MTGKPPVVDHADWLKAAAILMVAVGHTGYFFIEDAAWWSVFGRMAAPIFFFLLGYARSRTIPLKWLWLGLGLTLLDSANNGWSWMALNILFSLALIRLLRPYAKTFLERYGWAAFAVLTAGLLAVLPFAGEVVDYGAEGWLWGLFGLCQRMFVDGKWGSGSDAEPESVRSSSALTRRLKLMRIPACLLAGAVYVWQEQIEFEFTDAQLAVVTTGVAFMSLALFLFRRGPSRLQPPASFARALHFLGWHTLEIYVFQLAAYELIVMFLPELAA